MKSTVAIAEFKAHMYEFLNNAQKQNEQIIITKRGKPIATISPMKSRVKEDSFFGSLKGKAEIVGDIVSSVEAKWDAEKN